MDKQLIIATTYRNNGTKSYLIRPPNSEEVKVIETRDGGDGWLEDALNWAYEQGQNHALSVWTERWRGNRLPMRDEKGGGMFSLLPHIDKV